MWQDTLKRQYKHKVNREQIILKDCPYCGGTKYNLEVHSSRGVFHCWVCDAKGTVRKFFKDQHLEFDDSDWKSSEAVVSVSKEELSLDGFVPVDYEKNKEYLESRGLTASDIGTYNLLTATQGRYRGKLIIPLYEGGKVVYFVSRHMFFGGRYLNPVIDKKKILPYFLGSVNRLRLYIVEGAFDAISVHKLGFTVTPLLGSGISDEQVDKIKTIGFKEVVVALDGDIKDKAIAMYTRLKVAGVHTKIVFFPGNDDPNELYLADRDYLRKILTTPTEVSIKDKFELALYARR